MEKIIFTIVIFILFLGLISSGILSSTSTYRNPSNLSTNNVTIISGTSGGIPAPPVCQDISNGLGFWSSFANYVSCPASFVIWMGSLATTKSDVQWLGYLFVGITAILVIIVIRVIAGFFPTGGGIG